MFINLIINVLYPFLNFHKYKK